MFRSRKALAGLTQWFIDFAVFLLVMAASYVAAGVTQGWSDTYKVLTGNLPDAGSPVPFASWVVSIIGWLVAPALIGGLAGHVIATRIANSKGLTTSSPFGKRTLGDRLRPPVAITWLGSGFHATPGDVHFLECFVRQAHKNDWRTAQDHWEVAVAAVMRTSEYANLGRVETVRAAESFCRIILRLLGTIGECPVCDARRPGP
ncbi:DUF6313 family protein [Kitasatospora sp. NPDC050543]|uniref:DUF6313 family protein n=1 Tax=Kitasatospora sp. NPDC050543 TaxID=3364054 RepID=UPI00378CDAA8